MWQFERKQIAGKAVGWCIEHSIEPDAVGIVIALDELKMLVDPAAQQTRAADSCNCRHENNKDGTKRMYVNPWCPLHSNCR